MFDNIGGKIKTLAQTVCWVGIILSLFAGIAMMAEGMTMEYEYWVPAGFLLAIIGSFLSWVSTFVLYGLGQLIENTDRLVQNSEKSGPDKNAKQSNELDENNCEDDRFEEIKKETSKEQKPKDFITEIKETETADLELILRDQKDLYTEEEFSIIEKELASRK